MADELPAFVPQERELTERDIMFLGTAVSDRCLNRLLGWSMGWFLLTAVMLLFFGLSGIWPTALPGVWPAAILLAPFCLTLWLSTAVFRKNYKLTFEGKVARGTIVHCQEKHGSGLSFTEPYLGPKWYLVHYHYQDAEGATHHDSIKVPASEFDNAQPGQEVSVLYLHSPDKRQRIIYKYSLVRLRQPTTFEAALNAKRISRTP